MVVSRNTFTQRKAFVVYAIICAFLLFGLGRALLHFRSGPPHEWFQRSTSGIVVGRTDTTISVKDARGKISMFMISSSTPIMEGRKHVGVEDVTIGQYVIVETAAPKDSEVQVLSIRVFLSEPTLKLPKED